MVANFTRAAARLHLAQPGVSAQIRQLERELGQPLLDRSGRSVTPAEAGEAVLPYARAALAAVASGDPLLTHPDRTSIPLAALHDRPLNRGDLAVGRAAGPAAGTLLERLRTVLPAPSPDGPVTC